MIPQAQENIDDVRCEKIIIMIGRDWKMDHFKHGMPSTDAQHSADVMKSW